MARDAANPFFDMDVTKIMSEFKVPGVDFDAVMSSQRKNMEALTSANQLVVEGANAVARRQAEIMRQTMEEFVRGTREMMSSGSLEDRTARQAELAKASFERALSNMRELADMIAKSNNEAVDVINRRIGESLDEIRDMMQKRGAGRK
jgi:phasin family protein